MADEQENEQEESGPEVGHSDESTTDDASEVVTVENADSPDGEEAETEAEAETDAPIHNADEAASINARDDAPIAPPPDVD